jgi:hypothetical protein
MTLYKHGVGFFERRGTFENESVSLSFKVEEMNDVLKSLTAIDWGSGQVLGVDYATPQSLEEQLAGCSVRLADKQSLQDLLVSLRGRQVRLLLDQAETLTGILVGMDEAPPEQPLATALVSLLLDATNQVQALSFDRLQGVDIVDDQGASDLRYFLQTSLMKENYRQVKIRLTADEHDLWLSYIAPAPTWRVSYRLVVEDSGESGDTAGGGEAAQRKALLQGWGIFDNRLEEDLENISLSLVAGMPISFVYDLYTPFTPERPEVKEEERVARGPVEFEQPTPERARMLGMAAEGAPRGAKALGLSMARLRDFSAEAIQQTSVPAAAGTDLGELFQYTIGTPVSVGRGQSAMVPIVSSRLSCRKDLIYNGRKLPAHPIATLRLSNETGLTLERGPVTVLDDGAYVGEALLSFTAAGSEIVVPYAVELGVKVREEGGSRREVQGLRIEGHYLRIKEWDIRWQKYQADNNTSRPVAFLIEHPRNPTYELFDSPEPAERTAEQLRFRVKVPARDEVTLEVQERRLLRRREELRRQATGTLEGYLKQGVLDTHDQQRLEKLVALWSQIAQHEQRLSEVDKERQQVYKTQEQIQGNMKALSSTGKEGTLRASYVEKLQASEDRLQALAGEEHQLKEQIDELNGQVEATLAGRS